MVEWVSSRGLLDATRSPRNICIISVRRQFSFNLIVELHTHTWMEKVKIQVYVNYLLGIIVEIQDHFFFKFILETCT